MAWVALLGFEGRAKAGPADPMRFTTVPTSPAVTAPLLLSSACTAALAICTSQPEQGVHADCDGNSRIETSGKPVMNRGDHWSLATAREVRQSGGVGMLGSEGSSTVSCGTQLTFMEDLAKVGLRLGDEAISDWAAQRTQGCFNSQMTGIHNHLVRAKKQGYVVLSCAAAPVAVPVNILSTSALLGTQPTCICHIQRALNGCIRPAAAAALEQRLHCLHGTLCLLGCRIFRLLACSLLDRGKLAHSTDHCAGGAS